MIDPHAHLRDWKQWQKDTVYHGLLTAYLAGLDAVFEMPNTDPVLTSRKTIEDRIREGDYAINEIGTNIFHGVYAGITADPKQIEEVVRAYHDLFPRVVGLKMFAGQSTGNMGIIKPEEQILVYRTLAELDYKGVLAVHCEKESLLRPKLWRPSRPYSHTIARSFESEYGSVKDITDFASEADYKGILHICHISAPQALEHIESVRDYLDFKITTGITPHHAVGYSDMMRKKEGLNLKMNPPLRPREMQRYMLKALLNGRIDWIETDHAPHTLKDKTTGKKVDGKWQGYASGIPIYPYYPQFIKYLRKKGASKKLIDNLTHNNIVKTFGIDIRNTQRKPDYGLSKEYEFDPAKYFPKV